MTGTADVRWSSHAAATSRRRIALWTTAAVVTMSAHAGAAWMALSYSEEPPVEQVAGGAIEVDLAALGFSSADQVVAGTVSEAVETPVAEAVEPVETATPAEPVEQATPVEEATQTPPEPAPAPPAPSETSETPPIESPRASEVTIAAATATPVEPEQTPPSVEQAAPVPVEEVEPVEEPVEMAAIVNVPLPTPRPDYKPAAMPRAEKPEPQKQAKAPVQQQKKKAETPPPPKNSGAGGKNQAETRKGTAQGSALGRSSAEGSQGNRQAGNAEVSNYPGKVASKIRRSLRYPSAAQRQRLRGEVHVSFTVSRSGGLGSVRIARSSGSPILDQAAVETVRRAAPFPPIPDGRASWPFTVPLSFTR